MAPAAPTKNASPAAKNVSFVEAPHPSPAAPSAEREAVGKAGATHGPRSRLSVETSVAPPPESGRALAPPKALSPEIREAALGVLHTYWRTFVRWRVGEEPMPHELDSIVEMLERGYAQGQLAIAIVEASKSAFNAPPGRHSLAALMKPRVIITLVNRAMSLPAPAASGARAAREGSSDGTCQKAAGPPLSDDDTDSREAARQAWRVFSAIAGE